MSDPLIELQKKNENDFIDKYVKGVKENVIDPLRETVLDKKKIQILQNNLYFLDFNTLSTTGLERYINLFIPFRPGSTSFSSSLFENILKYYYICKNEAKITYWFQPTTPNPLEDTFTNLKKIYAFEEGQLTIEKGLINQLFVDDAVKLKKFFNVEFFEFYKEKRIKKRRSVVNKEIDDLTQLLVEFRKKNQSYPEELFKSLFYQLLKDNAPKLTNCDYAKYERYYTKVCTDRWFLTKLKAKFNQISDNYMFDICNTIEKELEIKYPKSNRNRYENVMKIVTDTRHIDLGDELWLRDEDNYTPYSRDFTPKFVI